MADRGMKRGHVLRLERDGRGAFVSGLVADAVADICGRGALMAFAACEDGKAVSDASLIFHGTTRAAVNRVHQFCASHLSENHAVEAGTPLQAFTEMYKAWPAEVRKHWLYGFMDHDQYLDHFPDPYLRDAFTQRRGKLAVYEMPMKAVRNGLTQCVFDSRKARKVAELSPIHFD